MNSEFSLLSLNTYGIPFFLSSRRLARMAKVLEVHGTTVICLQEVQQNAYVPVLTKHLGAYNYRAAFPHHYAPKGGLCTFSRCPMTHVSFEAYRDRGLRWLVTFADWALFKGVLITHLQLEDLQIIILNTHLNANYAGIWHRTNPLVITQSRQVQQLTQLLQKLPGEALIIVCGDFNFPRESFLYEQLVSQNGLFDPLKNDAKPTFHLSPLIPSLWNTSLDFIFLRFPQGKEFQTQSEITVIEENHKNPFKRFLTDHSALAIRVNC